MEPLTSGQYPHSMQALVKERLPKFTQEESKLIKGSFDFVGMNYYTTHYSSDQPHNNSANASFLTDARVFESSEYKMRNQLFNLSNLSSSKYLKSHIPKCCGSRA